VLYAGGVRGQSTEKQSQKAMGEYRLRIVSNAEKAKNAMSEYLPQCLNTGEN